MAEETLVAAADIARLAGVGRSAVSNWRRRYASFPQQVAGTPASPLFALVEVEAWLRGQGRRPEVPLVERAWQELRVQAGDELRLASALADACEGLLARQAAVPPAVAELAAAIGPADTFEVLLSRFHERRARGTTLPDGEIAGLMAALVEGAAAVLDPACGTGELLLAARDNGTRRLLGQEAGADLARLTRIRLRLGLRNRDESSEPGQAGETGEAIVRTGNALLRDAFPGIAADAVLCCPPAYPRAGDIVVTASAADRLTARVVTAPGAIAGPGLTLLRVDPGRLDAHFVAGALRSSANGQVAARQAGSSGRADISRALIAQLPLAEQRSYGKALARADELESATRLAAAMGASLAQLLADGIAGGTLEP